MNIPFYKYQSTGSDYILIDNRNGFFPKESTSLIQNLCHRRFGIGADGLILLESHLQYDFTMLQYNAQGKLIGMCDKGARCAVHFASYLDMLTDSAEFMTSDGIHVASISGNKVALQMQDVEKVVHFDEHSVVEVEWPHHVQPVSNLEAYPVATQGKNLYST